jgi:hypothetical protein
LVLLVDDSEYSKSAGAKPILSRGCIYLVLCSRALSSAAEDKAAEEFNVEVQINRIEVLLRGFPRTQFTAL